MNSIPINTEDDISQLPALALLQNLGWEYLSPEEARQLRQNRTAAVILDEVLAEYLRKQRFTCRGREYPFSEGNIHTAIEALKTEKYDGLIRTNEKYYDLLCLGKSLPQSVDGDLKSYTLNYIDWKNPENNVYQVTEEFSVERTGTTETYRPDIVLFVNGIPLVVIECKRTELEPGKDPIKEAISQHLRNQKEDGIPALFQYVQIMLALAVKQACYGTCGTPQKKWAIWREKDVQPELIKELVNRPLSEDKFAKLLAEREEGSCSNFRYMQKEGRAVTAQDELLWAICRPERLLELSYQYILFDAGEKKVARYQQYFCVRNIMQRIAGLNEEGRRQGGVVWHTQGSGKSLTMVMLAKAIALADDLTNSKVILVTDRVDLDDQIYGTFQHCGVEPQQATTGANLVELLGSPKKKVITTVINKFEAAVGKTGVTKNDCNIFALVDESHRSQFGDLHARMKKVLPRACYIGFTGTPIKKKDKSTIVKFGGLIQPAYTIKDAVDDKAVVPLLYEGRHARGRVDENAIDQWFTRITEKLSDQQKADLKKKYSTANMYMQADPVVREIAWDISNHYRDNWQGTPFKAQLVAPRKDTALKYKEYLDEFGMVKSAVLISGPDQREGEEELLEENTSPVIKFWQKMMTIYGTEKEYNRKIIDSFKHGNSADELENAPEIIIVVDKLLTGFDAPCNTVLYLCRPLKDHTLLQAIARVNRLHEGKDFGYILDYRGILENLDSALELYSTLDDFEKEDLAGTCLAIETIFEDLPQKHSVLWDTFKEVRNRRDQEEYERLLADDALRVRFYERFTDFARVLAQVISTACYNDKFTETKMDEYRRDLKFFYNLRLSVRRRYAEIIDFSEYEPKIKKLLDTYLGVEEMEVITGPINLFDSKQRQQAIEQITGEAAKADMITSNVARILENKWKHDDPAFYEKFSKLIKDLIEAFRQERINSAEYLNGAKNYMNSVVNREKENDIPVPLRNRPVALAYYGCIDKVFKTIFDSSAVDSLSVAAALAVDDIVEKYRIVNWTNDPDIPKRMEQAIEDYLLEMDASISYEDVDLITKACLDVARSRRP